METYVHFNCQTHTQSWHRYQLGADCASAVLADVEGTAFGSRTVVETISFAAICESAAVLTVIFVSGTSIERCQCAACACTRCWGIGDAEESEETVTARAGSRDAEVRVEGCVGVVSVLAVPSELVAGGCHCDGSRCSAFDPASRSNR